MYRHIFNFVTGEAIVVVSKSMTFSLEGEEGCHYMRIVSTDLDYVGWGLSKEQALSIKNYSR